MQQVLSLGFTSARSAILPRFGKFFRGLGEVPSHEVRVTAFLVSRDLRSVTGRNVRFVREQTGQDLWTYSSGSLVKSLVETEIVEVTN